MHSYDTLQYQFISAIDTWKSMANLYNIIFGTGDEPCSKEKGSGNNKINVESWEFKEWWNSVSQQFDSLECLQKLFFVEGAIYCDDQNLTDKIWVDKIQFCYI